MLKSRGRVWEEREGEKSEKGEIVERGTEVHLFTYLSFQVCSF